MTEDRFEILNDYLDGTLRGEERAALERRLETDAELAAELDELRGLLAAAAELPREATPRRDLWPGIERRLDRAKVVRLRYPRARTVWRVAVPLAAAAAIAIVLLARNPDGGSAGPEIAQGTAPADTAGGVAPGDATSAGAVPGGTTESQLDRVDLEYATASRDVMDRLERGDDLDPETVELIRRNLDIIDGAVREIREALDASPDDARLHHRLSAEYRRRGEVLRQAAELTKSI